MWKMFPLFEEKSINLCNRDNEWANLFKFCFNCQTHFWYQKLHTRLSHFSSINSFFKLKNKYYHAIKKIFKMSCIEKFSINNYYWSNFNDTINFNFRNTIFLLRQIESTISSSTSTVTSSKLFAELVCWVCISPFILSTTRHGTRGHFVKDEIRGYTNFFFFFFPLRQTLFTRLENAVGKVERHL